MKLSLTTSACIILFAAIGFTSCENMSPETTGVIAGVTSGALAGGIAKAAGASNAQAVAIGMGTGAAVGALAYVIAKHEATERQRRIAEERARLAYEKMSAERKARVQKQRYIAVSTVQEKNDKGAKSVMIYDTESKQVVGNSVYDVKTAPKDGSVQKYDSYSAEYVGS
jgi:lipopolysaccharide export LptBFGC system permease protein LptF